MTDHPSKRFTDKYGYYRDIDALDHICRMFNFKEHLSGVMDFCSPRPFKEIEAHPMQRPWMAAALLSLTREELLHLYDRCLADMKHDLNNNGDFTRPEWRAENPHLYG